MAQGNGKVSRAADQIAQRRSEGSRAGNGALSDAKILALKPPAAGQVEFPDSVVPGLRLRIGVSGVKTFMLRKRVAGKSRNITLGRYSERMTLNDARKKARQILSDVEMKADPVKALPKPQRVTVSGYTVRALWPGYRTSKSHLRKVKEIERVFERHILPEFGDRAADGITRSEITRFIDEIAQRTPVMARNILAYFSAFYTWALPRLDRLPGNPCRDAGRPPKPKSRERVLSEKEIGLLYQVLDLEAQPFGPAIQLLLLTGQRRNEVFEANRAEFDLERAVWTIPSDKLIPARGNWDAGPSGFSKAMTRIRAALETMVDEPVPHWTLHDLRRTLATGMQRLGVRLEVTEAVLNHLSGSRAGIVGVYQRHNYFEEKGIALKAWAKEVTRLSRAAKIAASGRTDSRSRRK
jgi:integrase